MMADELSPPRAAASRAWLQRLIWLVPAAALAIVAWLSLGALFERGPVVTITFATAEGLEANKTPIKYRSVSIGQVRRIALRPDRAGVVVTAELSRQARALLVDDARFWVVRPRVSMTGVSGISTLISGAYIGFDVGTSKQERRAFVGLEAPPSTFFDRAGRRFSLRAESVGSLDVGSPVYLRRVQVGQVTRVALAPDGRAAVVDAFVDAPHDQHVTTGTRFWNASGVDVTLGPRGVQLDTQSLTSLLVGGLAFETPPDATGAPEPAAGAAFQLYANRDAALRAAAPADSVHRLVFRRPVRGLAAGAPVELAGVEIGQVVRVALDFDPASGAPRTVVDVALPDAAVSPDAGWHAVLDRLVARGWRARTHATDLVTGQRFVSFEAATGATRAKIDWSAHPVELPTADDDPNDLAAAASRVLAKLERLPVEDLAREGTAAMTQLRRTLEDTSGLVGRVDERVLPGVAAVLGQALRTLGSAERTLSPDAPLQRELRTAARDVGGGGQALRALAEYLARHPESLVRGKQEDRK